MAKQNNVMIIGIAVLIALVLIGINSPGDNIVTNTLSLLGFGTCDPNVQSCLPDNQCNTEGATCGGPSGLPSGNACCGDLQCQFFQCVDVNKVTCGDSKCEFPETKSSCSVDCGFPPNCGNNICEAGETTGATYECPQDCDSSGTGGGTSGGDGGTTGGTGGGGGGLLGNNNILLLVGVGLIIAALTIRRKKK